MSNSRSVIKSWQCRALMLTAVAFMSADCRAGETITAIEGPTYAVGATINSDPYNATSSNPLAPFEGQSVTFLGSQSGGSTAQLGNVFLRYQYEVNFSTPTTLTGLEITEAGDFTNGSEIELLNDTESVIDTESLSTFNHLSSFAFIFPAVTGTTFFLEQYDHSTVWTYVQNITLVPEPSSAGLFFIAGYGLLRRRRERSTNR